MATPVKSCNRSFRHHPCHSCLAGWQLVQPIIKNAVAYQLLDAAAFFYKLLISKVVIGFGGLEEVVNFYNAVLTARDTVENPALQKMFDSK
jgi:hypothetical protein